MADNDNTITLVGRIGQEPELRATTKGDVVNFTLATSERRRGADGSWTALDTVETLTEPTDLAAALDADPAARTSWDAFPRSTNEGLDVPEDSNGRA